MHDAFKAKLFKMLDNFICWHAAFSAIWAWNEAMPTSVFVALEHVVGSLEITSRSAGGLGPGVLAGELEGKVFDEVRDGPVPRGSVVVVAASGWTRGVVAQLDLAGGAHVVTVETLEHDAVARDLQADGALDGALHDLHLGQGGKRARHLLWVSEGVERTQATLCTTHVTSTITFARHAAAPRQTNFGRQRADAAGRRTWLRSTLHRTSKCGARGRVAN
jgi:hypothetical protein